MYQSQSLDASNNDLAELPCSLGTLPKLQRIALDGNPLRSVRRDVIEQGCEAIKAFLRTRAATPAEKTSEDDFDPSRWRTGCGIRYVRASFLLPSRVDGASPSIRRITARRTRAASSTSPASIYGTGRWIETMCAKVRESLEQDEGLDAYVEDAKKRRGRRA